MPHPPPEVDVPTTPLIRQVGFFGGLALAAGILLFADLGSPAVTRTAAVAVLMAVWWITEALPLAVTALVPLVAFPLLGVQDGRTVAMQYTDPIVFLFIGGFLVALAMERWNLHRRIALNILARTGSRPEGMLLGFMLATGFISMWISNTATTMMMIPIGLAILLKWEEAGDGISRRGFGIALMLGIAYAASIGGMATLVGTPPNMSLVGIYAKTFPDRPPIDFARWMMFALPMSILLMAVAWMYLAWLIRREARRGSAVPAVDRGVLAGELRALGPMAFAEKGVLAVFVALALAWLFRAPIELPGLTIPGWSSIFPAPKFINDGTVAIAFALLLFVIPSRARPAERLLDATIFPKLPWGIVLLFGGGFALAGAFQESGLSLWVGDRLAMFAGLPLPLLIVLICLVITFLTEVTSNTASAQILLPVLAGLAVELNVDPLLLMVPGAISCSCAFMLPVATPPNAIAYATERMTIGEMVRAGLWMNLAGVAIVSGAMLLWGRWVFG